jgi:hypothetical protein
VALGRELLLLGIIGEQGSFRVSSDDGITFPFVPMRGADGDAVTNKSSVSLLTRVIPDGHGGALVGGLEGTLIRRRAGRPRTPWANARDRFAETEEFDSIEDPRVALSGTPADLRAFEEILGVAPPPALREAQGSRASDIGLWPHTRQRNLMRRALANELAAATLAGFVLLRDDQFVEVATGKVVSAPSFDRSAWLAAGLARTFDLDAYEDLARAAAPMERRDAVTAADTIYGLFAAFFPFELGARTLDRIRARPACADRA